MAEVDVVRCPACGTGNRVPQQKIGQRQKVVCGRCKTPLPIPGRPLTVTDATFAALVERSSMPVLIDLWAEWCGPCNMIAPLVDELATEMAGRLLVAKLNIDENPATANRYNVRSIPTLLLLEAGQEVDRIVGVQPKSEIARRLARVIG